jgi:pyruvate kinase
MSFMFRDKLVKTKIVSTLGPASNNKDVLKKLIDSGVDVFRLNFSHGTHEQKKETFEMIREVDEYIGILADIQGPKIRVGKITEPYVMNVDQTIKIFEKDLEGDKEQISIPYKGFLSDINVGDFIFINDGIIRIEIKSKEKDHVTGQVVAGGPISSNKGVNIPSGELRQKVPTQKDIEDMKLIAKLDPEFLAISFVANAGEVLNIRKMMQNFGNNDIKLISKIERPVALTNLDEIIDVSDGIMVARGDLGVEISPDLVPIEQKEMIKKCNILGKPVITATQMLESMTNNPIPTRAEANDVFNAVFDGTDAVMLSGETAMGRYPVESVRYMNRIANTASEIIPERDPDKYDSEKLQHTQLLGRSIFDLAHQLIELNYQGKILVITRRGFGCRMIAKYRPPLPIFAITPFKRTARELNLIWGVKPIHIADENFFNQSAEEIISQAVKYSVEKGYLEPNNHVIILLASRVHPDFGNLVGFYYVKEILEK